MKLLSSKIWLVPLRRILKKWFKKYGILKTWTKLISFLKTISSIKNGSVPSSIKMNLKIKNKLMRKTRREVNKWMSMKLNIILDLKNLEEHKLNNIPDKYRTLWGKKCKAGENRERKNRIKKDKKNNSSEYRLKRENSPSKKKSLKKLFHKMRMKQIMIGSFAMIAARDLSKVRECGNVNNAKILCSAMTVTK